MAGKKELIDAHDVEKVVDRDEEDHEESSPEAPQTSEKEEPEDTSPECTFESLVSVLLKELFFRNRVMVGTGLKNGI